MGRYCSQCDRHLSNSSFSGNQWRKGEGYSRCYDCVNSNYSFQCDKCYKQFNDSNQLKMHMQVHRPRNVACPVCGDVKFGSAANAVQHVESGYCRGCLGKDNARDQIYNFAAKNGMGRYMTEVPMLTNGNNYNGYVPDYPYCCPDCSVSFRNLSQLMQHQDSKHNNTRLLRY